MAGTDRIEQDDALASLVPKLAIELSEQSGDHHTSVEGSMLSADISGFTALSERLSGKGKAGAEEITALINTCFTALIDAGYQYGGEVLKFGGDAILVLFRDSEHERRSAAAAVAMQTALRQSRAAKSAKLTMTVGVATGPFDVFLIGKAPRELLICGPAASRVIALEGGAGSGRTLISAKIRAALPDPVIAQEEPPGYGLDQLIEAPKQGPDLRSVDRAVLDQLIPADVRDHFAAFSELGGEHRIATVGFLSVSGIDDHIRTQGPDDACRQLAALVAEVKDTCERFGVTILHNDIAENGQKFVLCAGAPVSRGDTEDAMLEAALEIVALETPLTIKVGVQRGRVFAGFLGSHHRRTYTLMGDVVNTAARMLGKARRGEVVAVNDVLERTRSVFVTEQIEPFLVKGKTDPISASRVVGTSAISRTENVALPLIGRERQLSQCMELIDRGRIIIELFGPAGAGKSRLLETVRSRALATGREIVGGNCSPYSRTSPYALLRMVLRHMLGIDDFADPDTAGDVLIKMIRHHIPELEPMAPVIAIPLAAHVDDTPEASAIDPKFLRTQINRHVAALMRAVLDDETVLILEDTHWIDDPSAEYFDYLAKGGVRKRRWSLILTTRPNPEWRPDFEEVHDIEVAPLGPDDIRELAIVSSDRDLTDAQLDSVVEKASGNPLFAIELAKAIGSVDATDVPDSVEQLISARIDDLDPDIRHGMRVAAVFGYRLRLDDLEMVLAPRPSPDPDAISDFIGTDATGSMAFTHALYREVAYEGLPFSERKRLHQRVGEHLEATAADSTALAGLLALHFSEARDARRTWKYGVMAGDIAVGQAANVDAAHHYERALAVTRRIRDIPSAEAVRVALALGDASSLIGEFSTAEAAYTRARKMTDQVDAELSAMLRIGRLREMQGQFGQARRWYERAAQNMPEDDRSAPVLRVRSRMHFYRSGLFHRKNDQQGCIIEARRALGAAEDANDVPGMAEALQRLHLATVYLGRKDVIGYGPTALRLFTELERFERQSIVLNNLGIEHYFNEQWIEAADFYRRSTEAGLKAGSMIEGMLGALNSGEILSDQGHWDEAIVLLESARRNWENGRYPIGAAMAKLFLGVAHDRRGDVDDASQLLEDARTAFVDLGLDDEVLDARSRMVVHRMSHGMAAFDECEDLLADLPEGHILRPRVVRARALGLALAGDWPTGRAQLLGLLDQTKQYGRALTLRLLTHFDGDEADPAWKAETDEILEALGVVRLRSLPRPRNG